ncbi:MAG: GTPase Era [Syntrophomonadaceae bacterium]|nr:GTPase Era [Syntrophomonadaceae bacterium]
MRSGFVSIIGRPNVGKSTLLNSIIGEKITIVTDKPQTTRNRIQGIYTSEAGQIIFVDTPGVHKPKHLLGEYMAQVFSRTINETDIIYYVVDVTRSLGKGEKFILEILQKIKAPVFLIMNKIDLVGQGHIEELLKEYRSFMNFAEVQPIAAASGLNTDLVLEKTFAYLPEGPKYYPEENISDQSVSFLVSELIREKALLLTHDEIPHSLAVGIEDFTRRENDKLYVRAVIYTERASQKGIIIGKNGSMMKKIGEQARADIEKLMDCPVYLDLWVKEKHNWRDNNEYLSRMGYRV